MSTAALFLSCEHGGNEVPRAYRPWFKGAREVLASHRGWDPGTIDLFEHLRPLADASISNRLSRLCIEFNRTAGSARWFSSYTRDLPSHLREPLIDAYRNYRDGFRSGMEKAIAAERSVLHVSVHSFTPILNARERTMDIGLLFDPARSRERAFCHAWRDAIRLRAPGLVVRMNLPYRGTSDGFTEMLRRHFPAARYQGIELEVNQRFARSSNMHPDIKAVLFGSLQELSRP